MPTDKPYGYVSVRCSAKCRDGRPCTQWAMRGGWVCKTHGGLAPQVKKKAAERLAQQLAERALSKNLAASGTTPVDNPLAELARAAGQVVAMKDALAARVADLRDVTVESFGGAEVLSAEVALFERALDRCEKFLGTMARLGFEERMVRLDEAQTRMVHGLLAKVWADPELGLSDVQVAVAPKVAARILRALPA